MRAWEDGAMTSRPAVRLPAVLNTEIHDCGYCPELVADAVSLSLGSEEPAAYLVHHEATFKRDEIQRHLSVLVLTASRLIVAHTVVDIVFILAYAAVVLWLLKTCLRWPKDGVTLSAPDFRRHWRSLRLTLLIAVAANFRSVSR